MNIFMHIFLKNQTNDEDQDDVEIVPEYEKDFSAARKRCSGDDCTLPPTQHLQIRVKFSRVKFDS